MVTIRRAAASDSGDFFAWRNDAVTRAASGTQQSIGKPDHTAWFTEALQDERRYLYVAEIGEPAREKLGMCRFDVSANGSQAEVSINLAAGARGKGFALPILRAAIDQFERDLGGRIRLTAVIRNTNESSIHLFKKIGFVRTTGDSEFGYYSV